MILGLIGGFIFVCALIVFWHIIDEVRDWWRSMREMQQLEKEIDAVNANAEHRAQYQALVNSATIDGRESDEGSSLGSSATLASDQAPATSSAVASMSFDPNSLAR